MAEDKKEDIRSGTLNVPGIVGFGKATEIAIKEMDSENKRFKEWSKVMLDKFESIGGKLNGHPEKRLPHNLNICFPGIESKAIINSVSEEIAISAGSACTTQIVEPSHVLLALGFDEDRAHSSIRIGMGRFNTDEEIHHVISKITSSISKIRQIQI